MDIKLILLVYFIVYLLLYIFIQKAFRIKTAFGQIFIALSLFAGLEFTSFLINTISDTVDKKEVASSDIIHFSLDEYLPSALEPRDTSFNGHMGDHKNRLERKVASRIVSSLDDNQEKILVCCYGGSSTYCVGVPYAESWPSILQEKLSSDGYDVVVHNHGIPGHNIRDAYVNIKKYPCSETSKYQKNIQLHYHGWNDIRLLKKQLPNVNDDDFAESMKWHIYTNRLQTNLTGITTQSDLFNFYFLNEENAVPVKDEYDIIKRTFLLNIMRKKMLYKSMDDVLAKYKSGMIKNNDTITNEVKVIRKKFRRYFSKYVFDINSLAQKSTIATDVIFIPQVLNYPRLLKDTTQTFSYWMPNVSEQFACTITRDIKDLLSFSYPRYNDTYNQMLDNWEESDFLDNGHFSHDGCRKFVNKIYPALHTLVEKERNIASL